MSNSLSLLVLRTSSVSSYPTLSTLPSWYYQHDGSFEWFPNVVAKCGERVYINPFINWAKEMFPILQAKFKAKALKRGDKEAAAAILEKKVSFCGWLCRNAILNLLARST